MKTILLLVCLLFSSIFFGQVSYQISSNTPIIEENLQTAISNIGTNQSTIYINGNISLTSSITIPKNITLKFLSGSLISLNDHNLTINGIIDAGLFQIFNCNGTGKVVGEPIIENAYPDWWKNPAEYFWSDAIQSAVDFYPKVFFSSRPTTTPIGVFDVTAYHIHKPIVLDLSKSSYLLTGVGKKSQFSTYWGRTLHGFNGFVFSCKIPPIPPIPHPGYDKGVIFENLSFFCENGIQINDGATNANYSDDEQNIENVKINYCLFKYEGENPASSIAIWFKKVFDSEISNNKIEGFGVGIKLEGSDINNIRDNRITDFYKYAILDLSHNTFGSQNTIVHNDLLVYKGTAEKGAFIKSTSNHIIIRDNYLENKSGNPKLFAYIDCSKFDLTTNEINTGSFSKFIDITGNRCDIVNSSVTKWNYYITEKFKGLNLAELPNISDSNSELDSFENLKNKVIPSTFALDSNIENPVSHIPLKVISTTDWDKTINMTNCESFKGWNHSFSTSKLLNNGTNGELIIDSKNISYHSKRGDYSLQRFNSRSFLIDPDNSVFIMLNQKSENNIPIDFFNGGATIRIKIRNYRTSTAETLDTNTNDLYFAIKTSLVANPPPTFYKATIDIPDGDNYSIIKINVPECAFSNPTCEFLDLTKDYYLQIHAKNSTKEIKQISIEGTDTTSTVAKSEADNQSDPLINNEEETVQTLIVKVDNTIKTYPNPVQTNLSIDIKNGDIIKSIEVYTETGAFIGDYTDKIKNNIIDISSLPNATYLVKVKCFTQTTKTIIKE
ncbi:T9SS type A sorting domain-containing protein [Flavobacterium pedocola]